jgi:hypothetical protein
MGHTSSRPPLWAMILCAGLVALWGCFLPWKRVLAGQGDFLSFYAGAMLVNTPDLYVPSSFERTQVEVANIHMPAVLFSRPPFYAVLLKPLTVLPYRAACLLFVMLNMAALAVCLWMFVPGGDPLRLVGAVSIPVLTALINGQDVLLILGVCFAAIALWRQGKTELAGLVLSLCAVKFHFFLFVPIVLIFRRQWRMLAGAAGGVSVLYAIGAAAQGWAWPLGYARFLQFLRAPDRTPTPYTMPNLHGLILAVFDNMSFLGNRSRVEAIVAVMVALAAIYSIAKTPTFELAFALAVAAGLLINVHTYIQDCVFLILVPALAPQDSLARRLGLMLLAPPIYFLLMADGPVGSVFPIILTAMIAAPMIGQMLKTRAAPEVIVSASR